jgi:chromosome partitioning protein
MRMKIVAVESQKGGSGKTMTALNLAVASNRAGRSAVILDIDPQASATGWRDHRQDRTPMVTLISPTHLQRAIKAAAVGGINLVIIDTAPSVESPALAAARMSDLIIIPCRASILDLRAIGSTAELAQLARKPAYVILNAVPPGATRLIADAQAAVATHGIPVAPVTIHQRAAFSHALIAGQTAQEFAPDSKAAGEIASLYNWLIHELFGEEQSWSTGSAISTHHTSPTAQ